MTAEEVKSFQQLIRAHSTPQAVAVRARIILRAYDHPEQNNQQIAQAVATTDRTVRKWRGRWVATRTLADAPRSGAPRRFSPQVRAQVTAIACSLPKQCQVPLSRWSRAELARHFGLSRNTVAKVTSRRSLALALDQDPGANFVSKCHSIHLFSLRWLDLTSLSSRAETWGTWLTFPTSCGSLFLDVHSCSGILKV